MPIRDGGGEGRGWKDRLEKKRKKDRPYGLGELLDSMRLAHVLIRTDDAPPPHPIEQVEHVQPVPRVANVAHARHLLEGLADAAVVLLDEAYDVGLDRTSADLFFSRHIGSDADGEHQRKRRLDPKAGLTTRRTRESLPMAAPPTQSSPHRRSAVGAHRKKSRQKKQLPRSKSSSWKASVSSRPQPLARRCMQSMSTRDATLHELGYSHAANRTTHSIHCRIDSASAGESFLEPSASAGRRRRATSDMMASAWSLTMSVDSIQRPPASTLEPSCFTAERVFFSISRSMPTANAEDLHRSEGA